MRRFFFIALSFFRGVNVLATTSVLDQCVLAQNLRNLLHFRPLWPTQRTSRASEELVAAVMRHASVVMVTSPSGVERFVSSLGRAHTRWIVTLESQRHCQMLWAKRRRF